MRRTAIFMPILSTILLVGCVGSTKNSSTATSKQIEQTALSEVPSGTYTNDVGHTYVGLSYDHLGYSRSVIRFTGTDASITLNKADVEASVVSVKVKASSLDTGVPALDERLAKSDFFDFEQFPEITFQSTKLNQTSASTGTVEGDLTIKGITKPVTLDVVLNGASPHPRDEFPTLGISASTTLKRSEFGIGNLVPFVGDEIKVQIEGEFNLKE